MATWVKYATNTRPGARRTLALVLFLSAAVSGCATVYDGKYAFREGWRTATVVGVVPGAELPRPDYWECTRDVPAAVRSAKTYAVVRRASSKTTEFFAVEVDSEAPPVAAGAPVYVNFFDCGQAPIARMGAAGTSAP